MKKIVENSMLGRAWMLAEGCNESNLINQILFTRGITDSENIRKFLNPTIKEYMPDPFVLKDMEVAVKVAVNAILSNKKIAIFGDYDVDGITGTAAIVKYLRAAGADVIWYLPDREIDGYGLNVQAIEDFASKGVNLLISVDCGISSIKEVERAKELGMQVIITDHHIPENILPNADAIVNPKRTDDTSGLNYLAGVGVAFMF